MHNMNIYHVPLRVSHPPTYQQATLNSSSFEAHLQKATAQQQPLKISKHAQLRMSERDIRISSEQWHRIEEKVKTAQQKGVQQPLVLMDQAALIISAKKSTVITAMDRMEAKEQIFTNIDGTIIL